MVLFTSTVNQDSLGSRTKSMFCLTTVFPSSSAVSWLAPSLLLWIRFATVFPFGSYVLAHHAAQTIVATALPTIVAKLGGGSEYSWVGRLVSRTTVDYYLNVHDLTLRAAPIFWRAQLWGLSTGRPPTL